MAEEEIGSKEQAPKSNRILFCYFFIVLLLGLVAIGILVRAFDTAFVEREISTQTAIPIRPRSGTAWIRF